jgi:hypothetical protein
MQKYHQLICHYGNTLGTKSKQHLPEYQIHSNANVRRYKISRISTFNQCQNYGWHLVSSRIVTISSHILCYVIIIVIYICVYSAAFNVNPNGTAEQNSE